MATAGGSIRLRCGSMPSGAGSARRVEAAEAALRGLLCCKINLQVRSSNAAVIAFYKKLGFAIEEHISMGRLL